MRRVMCKMMCPRTVILAALTVALLAGSVQARMVTMPEAEDIATNWIALVIGTKGAWGEAEQASVVSTEPIMLDGTPIGYCCHIAPRGHVLVSLLEGLAPVKAYSAIAEFEPGIDQALAVPIKKKMGCMLDEIKTRFGSLAAVTAADLESLLEIDYQPSWDLLRVEPKHFQIPSEAEPTHPASKSTRYNAGDVLLTSFWTQIDPYNRHCPAASGGCDQDRCMAGCVAIATGQIMNYWKWPPHGTIVPYIDPYDWGAIADTVTGGSSAETIEGVAELCHEVGVSVITEYCVDGCASSASLSSVLFAYKVFFFYEDYCRILLYDDYDASDWWDIVTGYIEIDSPIQYSIASHHMVLDGYDYIAAQRMVHFNMGWAGGSPADSCWDPYPNTNTWYSMDAIPCNPTTDDDRMLCNLRPINVMAWPVEGYYPPPSPGFPYRYFFFGDFGSQGAEFAPGQYLQFHRRVRVFGDLAFRGSSSADPLHIYTEGDPTRGIRVDDGAMVSYWPGGFQLHP